jgi:hypothetical protein
MMNSRTCPDERETTSPADGWIQACSTGLMILIAVGMIVVTVADWPPASWVNDLQGKLTGFYSRKLTGVLLAGIAIQPVLIARNLALRARRSSEG